MHRESGQQTQRTAMSHHYRKNLHRRAFLCSIIAALFGFILAANPAFARQEALQSKKSDWLSQDTAHSPADVDSLFTLVGQYRVGAAYDVDVEGDILYFSSGPFWVAADVSDPLRPTELARLRLNPGIRFIVAPPRGDALASG